MTGKQAFNIVVAEPLDRGAIARLEEVGTVRVLEDSAPQTLLDAVSQADALLVRSKAHVTARIINAAPGLKVIGRASTTIDHIDLRAAQRRNIQVVYAPYAAVSSAAEFLLGMILTLHRRIPFLNRQLREGNFESLRQPVTRELRTQTLGLLGIDPVGECLAKMCQSAFEMRILSYDPSGAPLPDSVGQAVDLEPLLTEADVLSVHLAFSEQTKGFLNAERLSKMKRSALVVNACRGAVIDTTALALALRDRVIAGAALDVFEIEPLPAHHPIRRAPNCILTPHVAGITLDAAAGRSCVAEDVVRVLHGEPPIYPVEIPV